MFLFIELFLPLRCEFLKGCSSLNVMHEWMNKWKNKRKNIPNDQMNLLKEISIIFSFRVFFFSIVNLRFGTNSLCSLIFIKMNNLFNRQSTSKKEVVASWGFSCLSLQSFVMLIACLVLEVEHQHVLIWGFPLPILHPPPTVIQLASNKNALSIFPKEILYVYVFNRVYFRQ